MRNANDLAQTLAERTIPNTEDAVQLYETVHGRRLTRQSIFGVDLLEGQNIKADAREQTFFRYFNVKDIFENSLNGGELLERSIIYFIELTHFYFNN